MKPKRLVALGLLLIGLVPALAPAQKPAWQPTEQEKLEGRVSALEAQLKEANAKADRAAMEKDYIERIQKKMNANYEKAFDAQLATITIIALVLGLIGKFRMDRIVQSKLTEARAQLESKFNKKLADELKTLKDSNAGQMKHLQKAIEKRIDDLQTHLTLISEWLFQFLQGMIDAQDEHRFTHAISSLRRAVQYYKSGKPRGVLERFAGETSILNLFAALWRHSESESDRDACARQELQSTLYDGLEDELGKVALEMQWLRPLVAEREAAPPALQPPASAAASATAQESPTRAPDNGQARKAAGAE